MLKGTYQNDFAVCGLCDIELLTCFPVQHDEHNGTKIYFYFHKNLNSLILLYAKTNILYKETNGKFLLGYFIQVPYVLKRAFFFFFFYSKNSIATMREWGFESCTSLLETSKCVN